MKNILKYMFLSVCIYSISLLSSCGHSSGNNAGNGSTSPAPLLVVDAISPVPLVSVQPVGDIINVANVSSLIFQPANYSVYIKNIGSANITGVSFSVPNINTNSGFTIDASNCESIVAGSSCRINITATTLGSFEIIGSAAGNEVVEFVTSTYPEIVTASGSESNALILGQFSSPLVLHGANGFSNNKFGSMTVSIINTYDAPIDVTNLFSNLPSYVSWGMISCPNPLPYGGVCQVRLSYNGPINGDLTVNLNPSGKIVNADGSETALPPQNSNGSFVITDSLIASLSVQDPSLTLSGNTPDLNNSTVGYIENIGTKSAIINSIKISSSVFKISDNQCIGQLQPQGICQYTITADVSKLANVANGYYNNYIIVNYDDGSSITQSIGQLNYRYTFITPANLGIGINGINSLNTNTTTGNITILNTSNVALRDISMPKVSGYTTGLTISDPNNCQQQILNVGAGCSFIISFTPESYNENGVATIGGITASYIDPISRNVNNVSFNSSTAINISTGGEAALTLSQYSLTPSLNWVNSTTYSGTIIVTNTGDSAIDSMTPMVVTSGNNAILTTSGCNEALAVESSCTLTVYGDYSNSQTTYSSNGDIIINYSDLIGSHLQAINISTNVQAIPIVTPGLGISGIIPSSLYVGSSDAQTVFLTLKNNTNATNGGNTTIAINTNSLINNIGTNLTGSLNTTGIVNNACDISGAQIILAYGQSCNLNLVLTATGVGQTTAIIAPTYEYYTYVDTSTTAIQVSTTGAQISTLGSGIMITARSASLNLAFYTDNTYSTAITSLSTEEGLKSTAVLKITNTGTTALTGIKLPTVNGLTFTADSSCSTLAPGSSCNVGVSLTSPTPIAAANLRADSISYTYTNYLGNQTGTTTFPSLVYQVTAPNTPSISVSTSFVNCGGNVTSTTQQCNLNPSATGATTPGLAGAYEFMVTYSNTGNEAANITVVPASLGNYNYYEVTNNCNEVELIANTGSCSVEYKLSSPSSVISANIPASMSLGTYMYTYGSNNQLNVINQHAINPGPVTVNITEPSLNLSVSPGQINVNGTAMATATISSWYAGGLPSSVTIVESGAQSASIAATCTANGNGCIATAPLGEPKAGTVSLASSIKAPDGKTISSPSSITLKVVVPTYFIGYYPSGCTPANAAAKVTGTCTCIKDPVTNNIWYTNGSQSGHWDDWTGSGSSLAVFNAGSHCGFTGGWKLPSYNNPGGDWGSLQKEALNNGYTAGSNFGLWLNNNGFQNVNTGGFYWSSSLYNYSPWDLTINNGGFTNHATGCTGNVLLVHGG